MVTAKSIWTAHDGHCNKIKREMAKKNYTLSDIIITDVIFTDIIIHGHNYARKSQY